MPRSTQRLNGLACGFDLFAEDAAEGFFELGGFAFDVLAEGFVDEGLIADGSAGGVGLFEEMVDEVFVEADGDAGLALRFRFWWGDSSALTFAEIVLAFHRFSSYCQRSWA